MGSSEEELCIKCNKGGKLLVCNDIDCPIVVHEKCMGCPAKSDDSGRFYCPYCLSRQAIAESRQARENAISKKKALSNFIDEEMMDCDRKKHKSRKAKRKRKTKLKEDVERSSFNKDEQRVDNDDGANHSVQFKDKKVQFASERTSVSPCRGTGESLPQKGKSAWGTRESNSVNLKDSVHRQLVFGHKTKLGSLVACGRDDVNCEEESEQFEVVEVDKRVQDQQPGQADNDNVQRQVEHHQENGHLVDEKTSKRVRKDSGTLQGNKSRFVEEENLQVQEQATTASSIEDDSSSEIDSKSEQRGKASNKISKNLNSVSMQSKHIRQNDGHKAQSSSVGFSKRSSPMQKTTMKHEERNAYRTLKRNESPATKSPKIPFPSGRRKKLLWTEKEEQMLKEGVQTLSSTANKNLSWRKILEFGHHIFHNTRTPEDLRDKWKKIVAQEKLAKE